jgi:hypothetical protein
MHFFFSVEEGEVQCAPPLAAVVRDALARVDAADAPVPAAPTPPAAPAGAAPTASAAAPGTVAAPRGRRRGSLRELRWRFTGGDHGGAGSRRGTPEGA